MRRLLWRAQCGAERALVAVVAQCYLEGVSTRRVEDIARALGIERLSKSQVSEMARTLDAMVAAFPGASSRELGEADMPVDASRSPTL